MEMLFVISDGNPENDIYVISDRDDEQYIRMHMDGWDHGGMDEDLFANVLQSGKITRVTSLDQVPQKYWGVLPFTTGDIEDDPSIYELLSDDEEELN